MHAYFWSGDHPHDIKASQLTKLRSFKRKAESQALTGQFKDDGELKANLDRDLNSDIDRILSKVRTDSAIQQSEERKKFLTAVVRARYVFLEFLPVPGVPPSDVGILRVTNGSSGDISNFSVAQGTIRRDGILTGVWLPTQTEYQRTIAKDNQIEIRGKWLKPNNSGVYGDPLECTIEFNRMAVAEAGWTDHLGMRWTTETGAGTPQLDELYYQ